VGGGNGCIILFTETNTDFKMGYWEGKCFFCLYWGTLAAIIALSINSEIKERKRIKRIEQIKTQYQDSI